MDVSVQELENIFKLTIDKLRGENKNIITLDLDYYFSISNDSRYLRSTDQQAEIVIESLIDDWQELGRLKDGLVDITYLDLNRLAGVLLAISEEAVPSA